MNESPDTVHGRLLESVHLSGYTFERACSELEYLLDKDRWKTVGRGFTDVNKFLATIDLSKFRSAIEDRPKLAQRLAALGASQRRTAKMMGIGETTVARALGKSRGAPSGAPAVQNAPSSNEPTAPNGAWFQADVDPTREAKRVTRSLDRQTDLAERRRAAVIRAQAATPDDRDQWIQHAPFQTVAANLAEASVDLVFTDPPYHDKTIEVYRDLGTVAARVLKPGASLITYIAHHRLPEILGMIQAAGLTFFWPLAMVHTGALARMTEYGIVVHWKPLLWFVKGPFRSRDDMQFVDDLIESTREKEAHPWQQSTVEARYYLEKLTQPDDLVFDPFCGGGTTAIAAAQTMRRCVTCDTDGDAVTLARQRLRDAVAGV